MVPAFTVSRATTRPPGRLGLTVPTHICHHPRLRQRENVPQLGVLDSRARTWDKLSGSPAAGRLGGCQYDSRPGRRPSGSASGRSGWHWGALGSTGRVRLPCVSGRQPGVSPTAIWTADPASPWMSLKRARPF